MLNALAAPEIGTSEHWHQSLLSSFVAMTQAENGDFTAIDRLTEASRDPQGLNLTVQHLSQHRSGRIALEQRLPLGPIDLAALHQLPIDSLGYHYADHMLRHQLQPLVAAPATTAADFIDSHMRETHDLWHVVTGSSLSMVGEIQLQAFCIAQLQLSRFWLALLTKNLLKSLIYDIEVADDYMSALTQGWIMGKAAKPLFGLDWCGLWEMPIDQVRAGLNITSIACLTPLRQDCDTAPPGGE
jgi:ubiquinone biosynthesis protein COQ4